MVVQDYHDAAFEEEQVPYYTTTIPPSIKTLIDMQTAGFETHGNVTHINPYVPVMTQYKAGAACYWTASYCLKTDQVIKVSNDACAKIQAQAVAGKQFLRHVHRRICGPPSGHKYFYRLGNFWDWLDRLESISHTGSSQATP